MSNMRDARHNSLLFNSFVVTVVLAHLTQLVWNLPHPLVPHEEEKSTLDPISPFNEPEDASSETETGSPSSPAPRSKETREIHDRQLEVSSYCSLLQTILDPRSCRIGPPRHFQLEDSPESFIDDSLLESNNIVPPHPPHADHYYPYRHPLQHHPHHHYNGPYLQPPEGEDSVIDSLRHDNPPPQHIPLDENGNEDETKIIRSKTMIIVPERSCPPGKRRDHRGYCRTVYRFQSYSNSQQSARGNNNGPLRLYYRRYVPVPTLHFILP